MPRSFLLTSR